MRAASLILIFLGTSLLQKRTLAYLITYLFFAKYDWRGFNTIRVHVLLANLELLLLA
jgi:hypothetical protein